MRKRFSLLRRTAVACVACVLTSALPALPATAASAEHQEMEKNLPPLQGPQYRYSELGLFPRLFIDIPAIPASVVGWNNTDWAIFSAVMVPGTALMLPFNPSMDASFQQWVNRNQGPFLDGFFPRISDNIMAVATAGYAFAWWGAGWISDNDTVLELASLTSESIAVAQFYHVSLKLLTGREGPQNANGLGIVHGFTWKYYPDGTPSGHTATFTALFSVIAEYYDSWALRSAVIVGAAYMGANLVYTNEHFFSDIIFGGAIGYGVGSFVVRNRSTRYRYGEDGESQYIAVMPLQFPDGGGGLQLVGTW